MKSIDIMKMTAQAAEDHLLGWQKINEKLFNDLKLIAEVVQVDEWEPGQLAAEIVKEAVVEYGPTVSDEYFYGIFEGKLSEPNLDIFQDWIDSTFDEAELLLLDQVLWLAMDIDN